MFGQYAEAKQRVSVVALLLVIVLMASPVMAQGDTPITDGLVDIGTHSLYIHCQGKAIGPTIVLESDLGRTASRWLVAQSYLAQSVRVCAYDRAGLGLSDPGPESMRTSQVMAGELAALLQNAGIAGPYILVADGFGTWNARVFANTYPDRVVGLVLVNPLDEDLAVSEAETGDLDAVIFDNAEGITVRAWYASMDQVRATRSDNALPLGDLPLVVLSATGGDLLPDEQALLDDLAALSSNGTQTVIEASDIRDRPDLLAEAVQPVILAAQGLAGIGPGTWEPRARMLIAHSEYAAAAWDGLIYAAGGFDRWTTLAGVDYPVPHVLDTFEMYDPATDSWTELPSLPIARHHHMMAAYDGRVYVFGGRDAENVNIVTTHVYDIAAGTWSEAAPLPVFRSTGHAVVLDGAIYLVGGLAGADVPALLRYDPAADSWDVLAANSTKRDHVGAAVLDGLIYAIGGRGAGADYHDQATMEIYDPATGVWTTSPAELHTARASFGIGVIDGRIYVMGGEVQSGDEFGVTDTVEMFDPVYGEWVVVTDMPQPIHGLAVVSLDDGLYVLGGSLTGGGIDNFGDVFWYRP